MDKILDPLIFKTDRKMGCVTDSMATHIIHGFLKLLGAVELGQRPKLHESVLSFSAKFEFVS